MVKSSTFGFHCIFFYYGKAHLMVNLYQYIKIGIQKNEYVYLNVDNELFKSIIDYFSDEEKEHIKMFSLRNGVIISDIFNEFQRNVIENGYSAARVIWDAGFLINELGRDTFINIEKTTSEIIAGLKVSLMCIYDFDNYINLGTIINKNLIEEIYKNYDHKFYKMQLIEI